MISEVNLGLITWCHSTAHQSATYSIVSAIPQIRSLVSSGLNLDDKAWSQLKENISCRYMSRKVPSCWSCHTLKFMSFEMATKLFPSWENEMWITESFQYTLYKFHFAWWLLAYLHPCVWRLSARAGMAQSQTSSCTQISMKSLDLKIMYLSQGSLGPKYKYFTMVSQWLLLFQKVSVNKFPPKKVVLWYAMPWPACERAGPSNRSMVQMGHYLQDINASVVVVI